MALTIHPMNLGLAAVDSSFMVFGHNPGTPVLAPCTSYLILGGEKPIMVDSGFRDAEELTASSGVRFTQAEDQTLEANLARHRLRPDDIGMVIHTHLHIDHAGLDHLLPNARIVCQRSELQYAAAPDFGVGFFDRVDIAKLVGPLYNNFDFVHGDEEVVPGVRVVKTGGHTPGHQMVYVDVDSGPAVITGDIVYVREPALTQQIPPGLVTDLRETMRALERIKRDAAHVLPMHDETIYAEYPDGVR
jgi:glyoxylase-like metal-dependent hydrolase (beta-lactamase superfamily II)